MAARTAGAALSLTTRADGFVPLLDASGTPFDAGMILGYAWKEALHYAAAALPAGNTPWWMQRRLARLVSRYAPHVPDLYRGMAKGAGIPERLCADAAPGGPRALADAGGCTSFALQPHTTQDDIPISGQTKDTPLSQQFRFVVLRLRLNGAPSLLTLTYPGCLWGHGFVAGGCAIFRNSLYAGTSAGLLDYEAWGLLALHCRSVAQVVELTQRHGVNIGSHCTVADESGAVAGIEIGAGGVALLKPQRGIYTHANRVVSSAHLRRHEPQSEVQQNSLQREARLRARLEADRGRLTPQLAFMALCDHAHYPRSVCRHESAKIRTTSAVVVEPTRRLMHCTRGSPCGHWPRTYSLDEP
jgi:hypothetical protein